MNAIAQSRVRSSRTLDRGRSYRSNRHHGVLIVWFAILGSVLIAFVMLSVDMGYVYLTAHDLQNASDSAALSGADVVMFDTNQAVTDAVNSAAANKAAGAAVQLDSAAGDVIVGTFNRSTHVFTAGGSSPNAVKTIARRTSSSPGGSVNLFFGPIFGVNTSDITRQSIAMASPLLGGVIVLNKTASPSVDLTGTGSHPPKIVLPIGGSVVVDSSSSTAIGWSGHPYIDADELYVVGNDTAVSGGVYPSGQLSLNSAYAPDPLASLPEPPKGTTQSASSTNLNPGYYPSGISGTHVLAAGIYYVDGGISLNGNQTLDATAGVMIFLHTGGIRMGGSTTLAINPPTTGPYAGVSFYSARGNTSDIQLQGGPGSNSSGTLYFPSAHVEVHGTPNSSGTQLIADTLAVAGDGQLTINYDGRNPIKRHRAFLVQ